MKSSKVSIKTKSTPASLSFKGQATKHTTVKWSISEQEIRHQFFLIWSNLTIMAHMMGLGNQSESWKIIIMS